jgi:hypothetical protein
VSGLSRHVRKRRPIGPALALFVPLRRGNPACGLLRRRNQTCVGTTDWLAWKNDQGPPLFDAFLRWFMMPMGLNSVE